MDTAELERLWVEHRGAPFPSSARGLDVNGVDVVLLDSLMAGCIDSFVENPDAFPLEKSTLLASLVAQLPEVIAAMDPNAQAYFVRLNRLGSTIVSASSGA